MKWISFTALFIVLNSLNAVANSLSIYGKDTRQEIYELTDSESIQEADSVVALFKDFQLRPQIDGSTRLVLRSYGQGEGLCADERFFDEPALPVCTGFLVAPDLILTAGHCIRNQDDCAQMHFGFGFAMKQDSAPDSIAAGELYGCNSVVSWQKSNGIDFALVRTDRPVAYHAPLELERSSSLSSGDPLTVIGFPMGLPEKFASGSVQTSPRENNFQAALSTFSGNSGSPVFNAQTHRVEGILVSGQTDFRWDAARGCKTAIIYDSGSGVGEQVTRISAISFGVF